MNFEETFALASQPERVWRALTEPEQLQRWFAEHVRVELKPGGAFAFWGAHTLWVPDAHGANQRVVEVAPRERLSFDWTWRETATRVHWVLDLTPEGVDLKIRHELDFVAPTEFGPPGCSQPDHSELIQAFWSVAVDNLRHFLANAVPLLLPVHRLGEREVSIAIWLDAPPARVFAALLDPDAMRDWMSAEAPVCEPRVGGRYDYGWVVESEQGRVPGGPRSILAMRQDQLLEHDWFWPDEPNSIVRWTLTPERGGTRLHLHHRGLDQDPGNYELGWLQGLFDLRRTLGGGISHA